MKIITGSHSEKRARRKLSTVLKIQLEIVKISAVNKLLNLLLMGLLMTKLMA